MSAEDLMQKIPQAGDFMLANPFLQDPYFSRAVIVACTQDEYGMLGFIVNKALDVLLSEVLENADEFQVPLHFGGPVNSETLYVIHPYGGVVVPGSRRIIDNVYWSTNFDAIRQLVRSGKANPNDCKYILGYAGWDATQVTQEIEERTWIVTPSTKKYIIESTDSTQFWTKILIQIGGEYALFAHAPVTPILN